MERSKYFTLAMRVPNVPSLPLAFCGVTYLSVCGSLYFYSLHSCLPYNILLRKGSFDRRDLPPEYAYIILQLELEATRSGLSVSRVA